MNRKHKTYGHFYMMVIALVLAAVVLIVDVERVGELRLQSWITLCDVEWIGVVDDVKQLCDVGLAGVAAIV